MSIKDKLKQAANYQSNGKLDAAADTYKAVLAEDSNCLEAINNMVKITYYQQDLEQVEHFVRRSLEVKSDNFHFTILLGGILFQLGKTEEAVSLHNKAIEIDPAQKAFVLDQLGRGLMAFGQVDAALASFKEQAEIQAEVANLDVVVARQCLMDADLAAQGKPYLKRLENVLVDGDFWLMLDGGCVYTKEINGRNSLNSPRVRGRATSDTQTIAIDVTPPVVSIDEPVIFIGGDSNYSHWLLRYISRLAIVEKELDLKLDQNLDRYKFVVTAEMAAWQKDSLALIGLGEERLVKVPRNGFAKFRELIVATQLRTEAHIGVAAQWVKEKFCPPSPDKKLAGRRVYISRRDARLRKMLNEEELINALQQRDFEIVTPSELSFSEQVEIFSAASVIIGPHGAGLTNIIFAPADCLFIELADKLCEHMPTFRWLAKAIGQQCITLVSQDVTVYPDATNPQQEHNFRVDIPEIKTLLDKELA